MRLKDLPQWLSSEFDFPLERATLVARSGSMAIEAPDRTDSETLAAIVERSEVSSFTSELDLMDTILCNLGDAYIGRKYYDDRGSNPLESERDMPVDPIDRSF